jgi:hypothetical protein
MSAVRVHRHRQPDDGFAAVPDETARDGRLTWAARGYLTEQLSNKDDWDPENSAQAAARAKREREDDAESARHVQRIMAALERYGYRHRVLRRGPRGRSSTETHYYDLPTQPCEDVRTCASCRAAGVADQEPARTSSDQGQHDVPPGGTKSAELLTSSHQEEQAVPPGGTKSAVTNPLVTADSPRRPSPGDQPGDHPGEVENHSYTEGASPLRNEATRLETAHPEDPAPDGFLVEEDVARQLGDDLDGEEERAVAGMLANGENRLAVVNKIRADRRREQLHSRLLGGQTVGEASAGLYDGLNKPLTHLVNDLGELGLVHLTDGRVIANLPRDDLLNLYARRPQPHQEGHPQ